MQGEIDHSDIDTPKPEEDAFKSIRPEEGMTVEKAKGFWSNLFADNESVTGFKPAEGDKIDLPGASLGKNEAVEAGMSVDKAQSFWEKMFSKEIVAEKEIRFDAGMNRASNQIKGLSRQEIVDGDSRYYDDNGKIYRVGNDLKPNIEYEINGYKYITDYLGRIISVEGRLHIKDREGRLPIRDSIEDIGKGDQKDGDDRGHLIGDQFDGSNGLENMIPQNADINRNDFKNFENELAKEVKDGKEVTVKVEPIYEGESRRPDAIVVTYSIDGEESVRIFPNDKEG